MTGNLNEKKIDGAEPPFSKGPFRLSSCTLHVMEAEDVLELSARLASMDPWQTLGYTKAGLAAYLNRSDPALRRYRIEADRKRAGLVCVRHPWLLGPCVELIALLPPCQGLGLGREVLVWAEEQARTASRNLWTLASSFNRSALEFYRRFGFIETAVLKDLVKVGFDEVLLRKRIERPGP